ncbi:MAG: hypothetical protein K9M10_02190 [Candidatus Pacebacteria bacterium]|nr:hypothetical protein [Candidatus Paceibacterota bacterium]MCF7857272.1 hypothetical protein [Candidatus Paceibacterota bacterium]
MIITTSTPEVLVLKQIWDSAEKPIAGLRDGLQRRLVRTVFAPAVRKFSGELILAYHKFISKVPSGFHSFAHGSEMVAETVHWVSVARIADGQIEEVPEEKGGTELIYTVTPNKVLVPVLSEITLKLRYRRNSFQPYFAIEKVVEPCDGKFDVARFGHCLFRHGKTGLDWATTNEIAVGNESVGTWLRERKSAQTYNMLCRR